jgi:hypothetical protein
MNATAQIAKQFRDVYFGGNWTSVNLKDTLSDVDWREATTKIASFNTIAALVYHINYYVLAQISVLRGDLLTAKDQFSFDHPPIHSEEDWQDLLNEIKENALNYASLVGQLPSSILDQDFVDEKYGNYFRNFAGLIEHTHYHLGQIVLIKKMIEQRAIIDGATNVD